MMVQPANYFQSLVQPATSAAAPGTQPVMVAATPAPTTTAGVTMTTSNVASTTAPNAGGVDDNGLFVLPDPPSDHQQDRDQVRLPFLTSFKN